MARYFAHALKVADALTARDDPHELESVPLGGLHEVSNVYVPDVGVDLVRVVGP